MMMRKTVWRDKSIGTLAVVGVAILVGGCAGALGHQEMSLLPRQSPDADQILTLQSNVNCQFFVDGQPLAKGRRVRVVVTQQSHQLTCKPDEYRAKEEYVQPPYDPTHAIGFTFLIEDKLQVVDKLVMEESNLTAEPAQDPIEACNIQPSDTLAVLPFSVNAKGQEAQRMGDVLAESVSVRLVNTKTVRVIERAQLEQLVKEAAISQTGLMDEKTVQSVGKLIGAKYLVVGNVIVIENALQVTGRILDVKTGEILMASQVAGPKENVFAIGQKLATKIENQMKGCVRKPIKAAQYDDMR